MTRASGPHVTIEGWCGGDVDSSGLETAVYVLLTDLLTMDTVCILLQTYTSPMVVTATQTSTPRRSRSD